MGVFLDNTGLTTLVQLIKGSLPTKATSSTIGLVKPDNSTITVDSDGVISSSGGGTTYTAGSGISIDANDVISQINEAPIPLFSLLLWLLTGTETEQYNQTNTINNMVNNATVLASLDKTNINGHIANIKQYGMTITTDGTTTNLMTAIVSAVGEDTTQQMDIISTNTSITAQYTMGIGIQRVLPNDYMTFGINSDPTLICYIPSAHKWIIAKKPWKLFQNHYFNSQQGLTSHSIAAAIDEVATHAPVAPTTDGNYVLKCVVSSGTPTYSWVSET